MTKHTSNQPAPAKQVNHASKINHHAMFQRKADNHSESHPANPKSNENQREFLERLNVQANRPR